MDYIQSGLTDDQSREQELHERVSDFRHSPLHRSFLKFPATSIVPKPLGHLPIPAGQMERCGYVAADV